MQFKQNNGFTFVELLLAVFILAGAVGGVLLLYTTSMVSSQQAWDTTVATLHAEHVLEEMHKRSSLESILAVNWDDWVKKQKLNTLPGEVIDVVFADTDSNLLDIRVNVNWTRQSRVNEIALKTKITK